ncbi:MAG: agmatine deiminase family protein, partial [Ignavibacteria bacterium]|nr:agmatine deiminase family protein [Ignavibacteria bacterium]
NGVPIKNLKFIQAQYNSVWSRDYGPWTVYSDVIDSLYIIDWIYNRPRPYDDLIPSVFANKYNYPLYQTTVAPNNLTHTGGNFMTDGHGTGFSSKLVLQENSSKTEAQIDSIMKNFMGINRFIKMDNLPYDKIHHIDMHMKLLDEETLLVGQYPEGIADGPQIELNLQYVLNNFKTCFGRNFKVIRIPMPPDAQGRYPHQGGDYRTYTNSVFVNKTVIVPTYELKYDTTALRIYREALPGYNIVGINSNQMISASGAIHCITKEIGVKEPIFISHARIRSVEDVIGPYEVKAYIKTRSGIESAQLYWSIDTSVGFNSLMMSEVSQDTFVAYIPKQINRTKVFYYISATSNSGKTLTKPLTSPTGAYQFIVDSRTEVENSSRAMKDYHLNQNYPNPFNSKTIIVYNLPKSEQVKLKVFDLLGREVATLVNEIKPAGTHIVEFINESKIKELTSGIYFYQLQAGEFTQTRKMILAK